MRDFLLSTQVTASSACAKLEAMRQALYDLVSQIPPGKVASYGELGRSLPNPVSGLIVGRWMASCPEGIPWWRVVAKSGELVLAKRGPMFAADQEQRLRREGVVFVDGKADVSNHGIDCTHPFA